MYFFIFWLGNVLRAITAYFFPIFELLKVARIYGVLYILTWKCVSHYNGVYFLYFKF